MVRGKLSVLWKMASPRRYVDQDYLHSIAAEIYGGNLREDPSLIHAHAENMKGASNLSYLHQLLAMAGWTSLLWLRSLTQPNSCRDGTRRSNRTDGEWPDLGSAHPELPAGSDDVRPSVHRHDAPGNREALSAVRQRGLRWIRPRRFSVRFRPRSSDPHRTGNDREIWRASKSSPRRCWLLAAPRSACRVRLRALAAPPRSTPRSPRRCCVT